MTTRATSSPPPSSNPAPPRSVRRATSSPPPSSNPAPPRSARRVAALLLMTLLCASPAANASASAPVAPAGGGTIVPPLSGCVAADETVVAADWQRRLSEICRELKHRAGFDMIIAVVPTVAPHAHARAYAERLYTTWRPNDARQERAVALLVSLKERQGVVVLGRTALSHIPKHQLDALSARHLRAMFSTARYGESLYRAAVELAAALSAAPAVEPAARSTRRAVGFWMTMALVAAMVFTLWRFTRPERRHPFQRWRRGIYWGTGQGGVGGGFGGFGGAGGGGLS